MISLADMVFWSGLQGAAIIGLAAALAVALRSRSAAVRHVVWTAAIGAQLLLPLVMLIIPAREQNLGRVGRALSFAEAPLPSLAAAGQTVRTLPFPPAQTEADLGSGGTTIRVMTENGSVTIH